MLEILLSILVLVMAIPFSLLVEKYTRDEIPNYKFLFRPLLWFSALMTALFYNINLLTTLTFIFIFIFVLTMSIKTEIKNKKLPITKKLFLKNKKAK